ncbi:MAG: cadherin-like beta sandwich domain-containing protein, partial [Tenericutes bacterium]|nr:cadherin-like beta sandwich domain-containing protein [Mycoplasmatota bacterium]
YKGKVPANTTKYEKNFKLRMWLDDGIDFSPVKDEDGNDTYPYNGKTFTLTVNVYANANVVTESDKVQAANANIKSVGINNSELTKVEDKEYQYEASLPEGTTEAAIDIETENEYSTVKVEKIDSLAYNETRSNIKRLSTKKTVELNPGNNYFKVTVTSEDKTVTNEYKIKIKVEKPVTIFGKKYDVIESEPTLTTSSNNTSDKSGLYKSTATNTGEPTYYFRGAVENNYVSFAGQTWRIVRINEDGTIRIVMQDGINSNTGYQFNSKYNNYSYMYYSNSEAKTTLESWYQTNIGSKSNLAKNVASGNYYCEQAKVKYDSSWTSGSANMAVYSSYIPDFKCTSDGNGKGQVNANVGLLSYDEVVYAGGYYLNKNDKFYLYSSNINWWTMSPCGFNSLVSFVWGFGVDELFNYNIQNTAGRFRPVINLKADTIATGSGTSSDPYVIS